MMLTIEEARMDRKKFWSVILNHELTPLQEAILDSVKDFKKVVPVHRMPGRRL